jgi:uncharacterized protein involved in exopolysaccharide biosynthesis
MNGQLAAGDSLANLSLRDFVAPLFRHKRLLLGIFSSVAIAVILLAWLRGPTYASRMVILVNRERLDPLVSTEATTQLVTSENPVTPEEINSEVELLTSRDVLEKVVVACGLENSKGVSLRDVLMPKQTREDRIARAVKILAKQIKVSNIKSSNLIEATYKSSDPQLSYAVLKSLGGLYVAKHVEVNRPSGSYEFFARETKKYHDDLESAESRLRDFSRVNAIAAPEDQRANLATQVGDSVGQMHAAEQSIAADAERIKDDHRQLNSTPQRSTTLEASAINDKLIDDLDTALLAAETKRTQLVMKFDQGYPLVQEADQEIAEDKAALADAEAKKFMTETTDRDPTYELLREDVAKSQADLSGQRAALAATKQSIQSIRAEMVRLDQMAISQQDLEREAKAAEGNYLLYLAKREQERTSNALDVTRISNVAIAVPPAIPVLPVLSWPLIILMACGSATVLAIGGAYAADYFDPSFQTPSQVSDALGIPFVVAIPKKSA